MSHVDDRRHQRLQLVTEFGEGVLDRRGEVGMTWREITPIRSNSTSRAEST